MIAAENAVFEDRGNGNLMWTGEVPGAGYESVVLTVQDGHLVGWFGEPGGPKYVVYAGLDGRGSLAVEVGPTGDWCGVEAKPGGLLGRAAALTASADRPTAVASPSSDDQLDILVLYPEQTENYWRLIGGPAVGVQQLGDLGGHHEPVTFGDNFAEAQSRSLRPYIFGHTDLTSCTRRGCPSTIMSYGWDALRDDDPRTFAIHEPFYSSVRHKPNGWTIGVAGTSEAERLFHETVPIQARSGEEPSWRAEQYPRRVIGGRWTGHDTLQVTWSDDYRFQGDGRVEVALAEGPNVDGYLWIWAKWSDPENPPLADFSDPNVTPIVRADGSQVGVEISGLRPGGGYRMAVQGPRRRVAEGEPHIESLLSDVFHLGPPERVSGSPVAPSSVGAHVTGHDSVRLTWRDNSSNETGYEVWYRKWSGQGDKVWQRYGGPLLASTRHLDVDGLAAEEEIEVRGGWSAKRGRYSFVVLAYNDQGFNASETFHLEFMPGPHPEPTARGKITDCTAWRSTGIDLEGYQVHACLETPDGARRRAWDYQLEADQSGLLYFFDRDNAEILVKVLDGCAINGHRWVFVAPVTTLAFRLQIREVGPYVANRRQVWYYDSERRPQERIVRNLGGSVGNPKDRTARTVSDTTAFPCTTAEIAAAKAASADNPSAPGFASLGGPLTASESPIRSLRAGSTTDCEPGGPTLTLRGGYTVSMCYETYKGEVGDARDWGLDSTQSGLMYFFERNNAEVLIKVLDGCGVNGHRWVFVAPVTDLAFNLRVENPDGEVWTHTNRLGQTADAASDVSAFPCTA